ncbi:MAG: hypothetical protein ACI9WS_001179 [Paraglaciecola psychrophila]
MSKCVSELLLELQMYDQVSDDFRLHILKVVVDADGEVEQQDQAIPVTRLEIDAEDKECLLHYGDHSGQALTLAAITAQLTEAEQDYELCASEEKLVDGNLLRYDTPLIGFGENTEINVFFAVCQV